jgi:DNA polymerase (family 10)
MKNRLLAEMFERIADALEFQGENVFKVVAYRRAARVLSDLAESVETLYRKEGIPGIRKIPGVGEAIARKIAEYLDSGKMKKYDEETRKVPSDLLSLLGVQGLGPKTLKLAHDELGVKDLEGLKQAMEDGSLAGLKGLGPKKVENIREGLALFESMKDRIPLWLAMPLVREIALALEGFESARRISPAGSFRRRRETVGDIDLLTEGSRGAAIVRGFVSLPGVTRVLASGETKGSAVFHDRYQVDLRVVERSSFGAALQYFTGSKDHNVHVRGIARTKGLKVSEYGVFRGKTPVAGETEEGVYEAMGMDWIPPEIREDRGEIEAAAQRDLPDLLEIGDIKGDLHVHSTYSDGRLDLEDIAREAAELGHSYVAVTDHSRSVRYARGLSEERLRRKIEEVEAFNRGGGRVRLLCGTEVDILPDGSLDYPDELLGQLDFVIGAIHTWKRGEDVTRRVLQAMRNPYIHALAHPTGRLIGSREGYRLDLEAVFEEAGRTGTALEINGCSERMDLNDVNARLARDSGVKLVLGTDGHGPGQMAQMELAVSVARRGWIEKGDILNTLSWRRLKSILKKRKP